MAPGLCCISGVAKDTDSTGTVETIHGLPTYISKPEGTPKGLIIMIPDAFGWEFPNNRVLCDTFAKKGQFLVYLPDFMNGPAVDPSLMLQMEKMGDPKTSMFSKPLILAKIIPSFATFLIKNRPGVITPKVTAFFKSVHEAPETKDLKVGAAGYCWGGKYTTLLAHGPEPLITAGFTAHPSNLTMPSDIENVVAPLCISVGDVDMAMKVELVNQAKEILEKKEGGHEVHILPGAKHGFAIRANPDEPRQVECRDLAEAQALEFFGKHLA